MRRLFIVLAAACLALPSLAQSGMTNVTASHLESDMSGALLTGKLCLTPVLGTNPNPVGFTANAGAQVAAGQVCYPVTGGALNISVPDTALAAPTGIGYKVALQTTSGYPLYNYTQPIYPNGATWSLDSWTPTQSANITVPTVSYSAVAPSGDCGTAPAIWYTGPAEYTCVLRAWTLLPTSSATLPTAGAANQPLVSTGAGTTYHAGAALAAVATSGLYSDLSGTPAIPSTGHAIAGLLACVDASASGTAQSCSTSPSFTPAANDCIIYATTTANTGTGLTLNVNGVGAKSVAKWLNSTTLAAGDVEANSPQLACYTGLVWNLSTIGNTPSGTGTGLTSVGLTMPTWLVVSNSPLTANGAIGVAAATGQTAHQVIGTCGTATSFGPCALVAADIPSGLPYDGPTAAATAQTNAETFSANAANISSGTLNHARLPALVSADIPANAANTSGSAASLSAASALPNATTATTQATSDTSTDVANDAYVHAVLAAAGGFTDPDTTLGDLIYQGASVPQRLAGPTVGTVAYNLCDTPSGGAATAPAWCLAGVGGRTVTTTTDTIAATDRGASVTYNSASAVAVTLTSAATLGNNFDFVVGNLGAGTVTFTPGAGTINGGSTLAVAQNESCAINSQDNTNYVARCGFSTSSGGGTTTIASGTSALGTSPIASLACATVVTTTATGTASTDAIAWNPNGSIKAVTGYTPSLSGGLTITPYPTSGNVNFDVCNWTASSITPGAVTLNWRVTR